LAAPFWRIKNISVAGLTRLPSDPIINLVRQEAGQRRFLFFSENNLWLFKKKAAARAIMANYNFAQLTIVKKLPGTLIVKIGERPYRFIFEENGSFYYAADNGYVIKDAAVAEADKGKYVLVDNEASSSLLDTQNKINFKNNYLAFILDLSDQLALYPDLPVDRFIIDQEFNTLKVKFINGPLVYFNVSASALDQASRLELVKKEKIKDNFSRTNYIDLRYGDRIFINPEFK
jgi:cell division septal protein FtsQ